MLTTAIRRLREVGAFGLAPGLLDAGLGSLAGLAGALYAARLLDLDQLGLFSLFFVMFQLLGLVPVRLILVPAQVVALDLPAPQRTSILARSLLPGLIAGLVAIPFVWIVVWLAPGGDRADYVAFGITTSAMILLSPLQDHCRFTLHMANRSSSAAVVSAAQLLIVLLVIAGLHLSGVPARWVPFLALATANGGSLSVAIVLAHPRRSIGSNIWPGIGGLLKTGRVLLPAQLLPVIGALGTAALVARLGSTSDLGAAEAARTVASPMFVAGIGLGQVLNPRIMEAARQNRFVDSIAAMRLFAIVTGIFAVGYLAVFGWSHPLNPAEAVIPVAFSVAGLVAFRVVASVVGVMAGLPGTALLGIGDNRSLLLASGVGVLVQLVTALAFAVSLQSYTVPMAELTGALALAAALVVRLRIASDRSTAAPVRSA